MSMFSYSLIFLVAFAALIPRVAPLKKTKPMRTFFDPVSDKNVSPEVRKSRQRELLFKLSFMAQFVETRKKHLITVRDIRKATDYDRQDEMVTAIMRYALQLVALNRPLIQNEKFVEGEMADVLKNLTVKAIIAETLVNIVLVGDTILQLPEITQRHLKDRSHWRSVISWGLKFANETKFLLDHPTIVMLDSLHQELNITQRAPDYENLYWYRGGIKPTEKKKKKIIKKTRGPVMFNSEL